MQRLFIPPCMVHGMGQGWVGKEGLVGDGMVDANQILVNLSSGTNVHVSYLGISHDTVRKSHGITEAGEAGHRVPGFQLI